MSGILLPAGCCCDQPEPGDDCEFCDGTPKYWTVTISGVDDGLCDDCGLRTGEIDKSWKMIEVVIDGVYLLTQTGDPCIWATPAMVGVGTSQAQLWTDSDDCTGSNTGFSNHTLGIALTRTEAGWEMYIGQRGSPLPNPDERVFIGASAEASDDDCDTIAAMSNDDDTCEYAVTGTKVMSLAGTATFEAGDQT